MRSGAPDTWAYSRIRPKDLLTVTIRCRQDGTARARGSQGWMSEQGDLVGPRSPGVRVPGGQRGRAQGHQAASERLRVEVALDDPPPRSRHQVSSLDGLGGNRVGVVDGGVKMRTNSSTSARFLARFHRLGLIVSAALISQFAGCPRAGKNRTLAPSSRRLSTATSPEATETPPMTTAPEP